MPLILISILLFLPVIGHTASCCGGGASSTGIMTTDSSWALTMSYSDVSLVADSNSQSQAVYRSDERVASIRTTKINYAHLLSSLWQIGINIPVVENIKKQDDGWQSMTGLGDLTFVTAYEFMPVYGRGIMPRGFVYSGVSVPTAPSIFTSKRNDLLDSRGTGHYHLLLGTFFQKRFEFATVSVQPQLAYRFGRNFSDNNFMHEKVTTDNSLDHLITLSAATDLTENTSTSVSVTRNYMQSKATSTLIGTGQSSLVHDFSMSLGYTIDDESTLSFIYTDQFLVAESYNHTLARSLGFSYLIKSNL